MRAIALDRGAGPPVRAHDSREVVEDIELLRLRLIDAREDDASLVRLALDGGGGGIAPYNPEGFYDEAGTGLVPSPYGGGTGNGGYSAGGGGTSIPGVNRVDSAAPSISLRTARTKLPALLRACSMTGPSISIVV